MPKANMKGLLAGLLLSPNPRVSDSVELAFLNKFAGDANDAGPLATRENH